MPFKLWSVGEEVIASDFNPNVAQQIVAVFSNAAARAAGWTAPPQGALSELLDSPGALWTFIGTAWVQRSATVICTSTTRPTTGLYAGLEIYETDTGRRYIYDGAAWQSSGQSSRSWTVISDIVLGADGPITFAAIPQTYTHLQVIATVRTATATATDSMLVRLNSDGGANYFDGYVQGSGNAASASSGARTGGFYAGVCEANSGAAGRQSAHTIDLPSYTDAARNKIGMARGAAAEGGIGYEVMSTWLWLNNAAITQIDLIFATGLANNWRQGSHATLLGIK